ncbi:MAG TPA: DUF2917 domain-containing protein [Noviherbaspirillum sp.]|nr:DUF2917 domain-containing protein [Noviherbaspirillum sp.]
MNPRHSLSPQVPDPVMPAMAGQRSTAAFPHAMGAALRRAVKGLLALVPPVVHARTARPLAAEDSKSAQCSGQWIEPRQPLVLPMSSRLVIACDAGTVWITQGDNDDYVLKAREEAVFQPAGKVVVTAIKGSALVRHGQPTLRVPDKRAF